MKGNVILLAGASYTMVAPTTHFEMETCPDTLGTSSPHAWEQCLCFYSSYKCRWEITSCTSHNKTLDKRGLLLAGVRHPVVSPTAHLELKSQPNTLQASFRHT